MVFGKPQQNEHKKLGEMHPRCLGSSGKSATILVVIVTGRHPHVSCVNSMYQQKQMLDNLDDIF